MAAASNGNPYLRTPLGFAGGLHDWDTGLVRFGWRDYDPDTGRFTAQDPIGAAGGDPDWYGYCLDDPVNGRDPEGLMSLRGTIWDKPMEERGAEISDQIGDDLRAFEVFTKGIPENPVGIVGQIAVNTMARKKQYRENAAESESLWEKEAYKKLADNVSVAGETINLMTGWTGYEKGNEIVTGAMSSVKELGGKLGEKIGEIGDNIAKRKRKTRGEQ
ncbi:MAG: RHS repeat-associated core domain-containing protein [Desulfovibrio sp.]